MKQDSKHSKLHNILQTRFSTLLHKLNNIKPAKLFFFISTTQALHLKMVGNIFNTVHNASLTGM